MSDANTFAIINRTLILVACFAIDILLHSDKKHPFFKIVTKIEGSRVIWSCDSIPESDTAIEDKCLCFDLDKGTFLGIPVADISPAVFTPIILDTKEDCFLEAKAITLRYYR